MVGRLARKMEKEPENLEGWLMLGRSYAVIEQYPSSAGAYQRANLLAKGQNADALTGLAEALVLSNQSDLGGRAGRLFEDALALDPGSTKALFYSAIAALERGDNPLAREALRQVADRQSSTGGAPHHRGAGAADGWRGAARDSTGQRRQQLRPLQHPAAARPLLQLSQCRCASLWMARWQTRAQAGAPLFVLARIPGQRGPPLAAKRLDAKFPQDVNLLNSDAMIAGTGFAAGQEIEIEARIANGGSAISRSGDPFGTARLKAGAGSRVTIEINQLKP